MKIDKFAHNALKEFLSDDEIKEAVWLHKQSGQYIAKHKWLEVVATKANIKFDVPQIVEVNAEKKLAVILVSGTHKERTEWSFGESAPYNTQIAYPLSMAEKRAKDRVILKLLGLHGFVYSEDESDDFKEPKPHPAGDMQGMGKTNNGKTPTELGFKSAAEFKREYQKMTDKINKAQFLSAQEEIEIDSFQELVSAYDPTYGESFRDLVERNKQRIGA